MGERTAQRWMAPGPRGGLTMRAAVPVLALLLALVAREAHGQGALDGAVLPWQLHNQLPRSPHSSLHAAMRRRLLDADAADGCRPGSAATTWSQWTDSSSKIGKYAYWPDKTYAFAIYGLCDWAFNYVPAYFESQAEQSRVEAGLNIQSCEWPR